jgi:uncharacterized membrane protein
MFKHINTYKVHQEQLSRSEKFALWLTNKVGTIGFFFLIFIWTIFWLSWNMFAPTHLKFDPYPAFVLWLFISNGIQIFLMPLIMVSQNLQARHTELRAENDFQINVKAEKEIAELKQELIEIKKLLEYRKY